jgi:hypothetical protein
MVKKRSKSRWAKPSPGRHHLLARALKLVIWIQGLKYGATLEECTGYLGGKWCSRTVRRDLGVLVSLGVLFPDENTQGKTIWKVNPVNNWRIEDEPNGKTETRDDREIKPSEAGGTGLEP